MSPSARLAHYLYWFMVLLGGAILVPALILPAWLEYRASLEIKAFYQQQYAEKQEQFDRLRAQREHLATDDAYVLRLAREQLNIETPGVEHIPVEPGALPTTAPAEPESAILQDELAPELSALIEKLLIRYPLTGIFVRPQTRPFLLFIGGGLVFVAVVLLGNPYAVVRPPKAKAAK
ncbi:MAG: hypothetical protein PVJ57_09095 [Phycisphaerae bacterium]|jgi:hypothetical protein